MHAIRRIERERERERESAGTCVEQMYNSTIGIRIEVGWEVNRTEVVPWLQIEEVRVSSRYQEKTRPSVSRTRVGVRDHAHYSLEGSLGAYATYK